VLSCSKQQFCPCRGFAHIDKVVQQIRSKNAEKKLFGTDNYMFFIRTIQHLLGNHQVRCMDRKGLKDFQLDKQSLESIYDHHSYLLRGQGFLWYTVLMRAQIHTNALYICSKIAYPSDCQELCQEFKLDDDNLFTYESYNQL
jgi:hypothetical protein